MVIGKSNPYEDFNNKKLGLAAKKLTSLDRHKFNEAVGTVKTGRTRSTNQILKTVSDAEGYKFKNKIKDKLFTTKGEPSLTPEQVRRNLNIARGERIRAEAETQDEPRATFFQPGSNEAPHHDNAEDQINQTGMFQPR